MDVCKPRTETSQGTEFTGLPASRAVRTFLLFKPSTQKSVVMTVQGDYTRVHLKLFQAGPQCVQISISLQKLFLQLGAPRI